MFSIFSDLKSEELGNEFKFTKEKNKNLNRQIDMDSKTMNRRLWTVVGSDCRWRYYFENVTKVLEEWHFIILW